MTEATSRKTALITGASRGLGRSTALHLARAGVDVVGTYVAAKDAAESLVEEVRAAGSKAVMLPLDVADSSSFPAFVEQLQRALHDEFERDTIDFLVNNAGTSSGSTTALPPAACTSSTSDSAASLAATYVPTTSTSARAR